IAAAQALDFRDFKVGKGTRTAHTAIRKVVEHLDVDRPLYTDHNNMMEAVRKREILHAVEEKIGELRTY
ncbi:MAG: phenylalanine ammonia-lyase, partial [Candidatus Cloacimonetes bacterium]|nr:phenylalanine ammonia-lyase [Candidatus Cloacimonadota bacterium]